jgi:hypothetical protein
MNTNTNTAAPSTNNTDEENTVNTNTNTNTTDTHDAATDTIAVEYYDETGAKLGAVETGPVTVARLRAHAENDSSLAASLLFRALIAPELVEAYVADMATWNETLKRGIALSELVGSKQLAAQILPVLHWYARNEGDLFTAWSARDAERMTRPTLSGIAAYAASLLSGVNKQKITAADVLKQVVDGIHYRIRPLEKDNPDVYLKLTMFLTGATLGAEEKRIFKRALKPKA